MFYYFYQVLSLSKNQLTFFYPENQVWSVVTQGVMIGFFTICGLFASIMCLLYFYEINTNVAVYAIMSLLGLSLSVIVGLAFSAYLRCQFGESFSASEIECVKEFILSSTKQVMEQAAQSQQTANALKSRADSISKMGVADIIKDAAASGDASFVETSRKAAVNSQTAPVSFLPANQIFSASAPQSQYWSAPAVPSAPQPQYWSAPAAASSAVSGQMNPLQFPTLLYPVSPQIQQSGVTGILAGASH